MRATWRRLTDLRPFVRRHSRLFNAARLVTVFSAAFGGAYGFISGSRAPHSGYDPHAFAIGVSFLFALSCAALAALILRNRLLKRALRGAALQNEALTVSNRKLQQALDLAHITFGAHSKTSLACDPSEAIVTAFAQERLHASALRPTL